MDKLQWGNRKWLRRAKLKDSSINGGAGSGSGGGGVDGHHDLPPLPSNHHLPHRSSASENGEASKEEKCNNSSKRRHNEGGSSSSKKMKENGKIVWPRLLIALSSKEKEEDFMIMKGCKPSQRPKKRAKSIQRDILVSPGAWLTDVCQERYQVREEKTCKKKPSGLKAMESMEIDSE